MLELLAQNHKLWITMVLSMGASPDVAEDLVQSMYLRLYKYISDPKRIMFNDKEINKFFVYVTLRNIYLDYRKLGSKYNFCEIDNDVTSGNQEDEYNEISERDMAFERLIDKIKEEMKSWHSYDRILSEKYLSTDYSLRDIANGSGISLTSIFHTMKKNKELLNELFIEDYEDFINGDYDLI